MITSVYSKNEIEREILRSKAKSNWMKHFIGHIHLFDPIQDIVRLYGCWECQEKHPKRLPKEYEYLRTQPTIQFLYIGKAINEIEAREDLAEIMRATGCIFGDIIPASCCATYYFPKLAKALVEQQHNFHGEYRGEAPFGDMVVKFVLFVPWLPNAECVFTYEEKPAYPPEVRWSIECAGK